MLFMATEGGFTIRPYLPQTEEQQLQAQADRLREEQEEREKRIALYQSFKNSPLHPNCTRVYYPACGSDDALAEAFPKSEVHLVDIKKESIDELVNKHLPPNVHAVEASITDYDPGPVDVLVVHGADFGMWIDKAINIVKDGGFVLSGDDAASDLRDELLHRPDLELAGILRPVEEPIAETVAGVRQETRRDIERVSPEFRFEEGRREHAELVETDEKFQRAHPALFRHVQGQWEVARAHDKDQSVPKSILAFAKTIDSVPIAPKQPGAALWIFRKLSRDVQADSVTSDRVKFLEGVFALDQSDPERTHAYECHQKLIERERDVLGTAQEDIYWDALSREALHASQLEAGRGDHGAALEWVRKAIGYASRVQSEFYTFDWVDYLHGTEAYLSGDTERLQMLVRKCNANQAVVERLLNGLKTRGSPDYAHDYGGIAVDADTDVQIPTTETQTQTLISEENARHLQDLLKLDGLKQMNPLEVAWRLVLHKHPELAEVVREQDNSSRFDGGSIMCPTSEEETLKITYNNLDLSVIEELMQHRPKSAALVAEQLGISREELSPLLLKTFIFLHEFGHAYDYLLNFLKPLRDEKDALPKTHATANWRAKFKDEMAALPIPNMNPSRLRMFSMFAPLPELAKQQGATDEIVRLAERDPEAVLQLQEESYKSGESEKRADSFATSILREHVLMNLHHTSLCR